jgi:polar amino acid transport system substrate-binding protein
MYEAVKTGTAVACFEDAPVIAYGCAQGNGLKVITDLEDAEVEGFEGSPYGFAVMKDQNTELLEKFQAGLKNIIESGKMAEICEKYGVTYEG